MILLMTFGDLRDYVRRLARDLDRRFDPKPELSARPALQALLEALVADRELIVTSEPRRTTAGCPDFVVKTELGLNVGHIEAKAPGSWHDLDRDLTSTQLARYRANFPNLLVTDYIHAILLRDGREITRATLLPALKPGHEHKLREDDLRHFSELLQTFFAFLPEPVTSPGRLASLLARYASIVRVAMEEELGGEPVRGPLRTLLHYFEQYLHPGADAHVFADAIAQSVIYALMVARMTIGPNRRLDIKTTPRLLPKSLDFLSSFVQLVQGSAALSTVEWALNEACELLQAVPDDVLQRAGQPQQAGHGARHDPAIYFYEKFLEVYDREVRIDRGVYYTPVPLVEFIVRAVDDVLQGQFDLDRGLADPKVILLDPACGTGTFLVAAATKAIHTIRTTDGAAFIESAIQRHIIKHFIGFEVQACPYTIAHIKMARYLAEAAGVHGAKMSSICPRIYLSNTLAKPGSTTLGLDGATLPIIREVLQEGVRANEVKESERVLVIVGNPPYKRETHNQNTFIDELLEDFFKIDGQRLPDRNTTPLQSDELRFLRWSVWKLLQNEAAQGHGVIAFVTNHAFVRRRLHRAVRKFLFDHFDEIFIFDLLGNRRAAFAGEHDENVFPPVKQGICICVLVRRPEGAQRSLHARVHYRRCIGPRDQKFKALDDASLSDGAWSTHTPASPTYSFVPPRETDREETYESSPRVVDMFGTSNSGVITGADQLLVAFAAEEVEGRMKRFLGPRLDKQDAAELFGLDIKRSRSWLNIVDGRRRESRFDRRHVVEWTYRPGDRRFAYLARGIVKEYRNNITPSAITAGNVTLAVASGGSSEARYAWVSDGPMPQAVLSSRTHGRAGLFPAQIHPGDPGLFGADENLSQDAHASFKRIHGKAPSGRTLLDYVYGVLWSGWWREQFAHKPFEDDDYPRIPIAADAGHFSAVAAAGAKLVGLHLLRTVKGVTLRIHGKRDLKIEHFEYDAQAERVTLGESELGQVTESDVSFTVGGYPLLRQWFEARIGEVLGVDDLTHLRKTISMIRETPDRVAEIDRELMRCAKSGGFAAWEDIPRDAIRITAPIRMEAGPRKAARSQSAAGGDKHRRGAPRER
jgi:hypothetical protein